MPSADQVPVKNPHSTMHWHEWVVLIAGSTGSALRAFGPPNFHITPVSGAICLRRKRDGFLVALTHGWHLGLVRRRPQKPLAINAARQVVCPPRAHRARPAGQLLASSRSGQLRSATLATSAPPPAAANENGAPVEAPRSRWGRV
jgi:hypothetical protein